MTWSATAARRLSDRPRLARSISVGAVALVAASAVAGCTTMSPAQTQVPYQPADGVAVDIGPVQVRDLLVVASAAGATGVVSGSVINTTTSPVTVAFAAAAGTGGAATATPTPIELRAGEQRRITGVEIPAVAAAPGGLTAIDVTTAEGVAQAQVPVLPPDNYYATLTPSPTPTPAETTPSATATTDATATPTAGATTTSAG